MYETAYKYRLILVTTIYKNGLAHISY